MNSQAITTASHYDEEYFKYQSEIGRFGGWANLTKFSDYIRPEMKVLDFGCGGGYLLANINCQEKLGIEISPVAREAAQNNGINALAATSQVEDGWADISHFEQRARALPEPAPGASGALAEGSARAARSSSSFPANPVRNKVTERTIPIIISYCWSPMSAANLFTEAGFQVHESKAYVHIWPPRFIPRLLRSIGGRPLFELGCRLYGFPHLLEFEPCGDFSDSDCCSNARPIRSPECSPSPSKD